MEKSGQVEPNVVGRDRGREWTVRESHGNCRRRAVFWSQGVLFGVIADQEHSQRVLYEKKGNSPKRKNCAVVEVCSMGQAYFRALRIRRLRRLNPLCDFPREELDQMANPGCTPKVGHLWIAKGYQVRMERYQRSGKTDKLIRYQRHQLRTCHWFHWWGLF